MLVIKAGKHKMRVRIANRVDPNQTATIVFEILEHLL